MSEPLTNIAVSVIDGYKAGLAGEPMGFVNEAFDCGWYSGDHERRAALTAEPSQPKALTDEQIRALFLENGFTIKEGLRDLKPYVYAAARAVISADRACRLPEMPALTDEQIDKIANESGWPPSLVAKPIQAKLREFARAVEALCRGKV